MFDQPGLDKYVDEIAKRIATFLAPSPTADDFRNQRLLTIEQAAQYLGRTEEAIKLLIHRGKLPVTKIDSKRQIDKRELDKLIESRTYFNVDNRT